MCSCCIPLIKAIDKYLEKADNDLKGELGDEGYENPEEIVDCISEMEEGVTEALEAESKHIVSGLKDAGSLMDFAERVWPKISQDDIADKSIRDVVEPLFSTYIPRYTTAYIQATDRQLTCQRLSKPTISWIGRWAADLGKLMKLSTHQQLQDILQKGLGEGIGMEEFTRRILDSGIRDVRYKARRVAVTEVLTAHRVAQQEAYSQSPSVEYKAWKHSSGYRIKPRENHVRMNGQTVKVEEPYNLTGADGTLYHPMYPGDTDLPAKERINCHCISQPVVSEEILGLSLEERQRLQQQAIDEMDDNWMRELDEQNRRKAGIDPSTPGDTGEEKYDNPISDSNNQQQQLQRKYKAPPSDADKCKTTEEVTDLIKDQKWFRTSLPTVKVDGKEVADPKYAGLHPFLNNSISLDGVDLESARLVYRGLNLFFTSYPFLNGKLFGVRSEEIPATKDGIAIATGHSGGYGSIKVNTLFFNNIDTLVNAYYDGTEDKTFTQTDDPAAVIAHELGHNLEGYLTRLLSSRIGNIRVSTYLIEKLCRRTKKTKEELARSISLDASFSDNEFFAECIANLQYASKRSQTALLFKLELNLLLKEYKKYVS